MYSNINNDWTELFNTIELVGEGLIEGFTEYKEFIIVISATGFYVTHHIGIKMLIDSEFIPFVGSWIHETGTHSMATIALSKNGTYIIGQGVGVNSESSSISIWGKK